MKIFYLPKSYEYYINSEHLFFLHNDPFSMTTKYQLWIIRKEMRAKKMVSLFLETSSFMLISVWLNCDKPNTSQNAHITCEQKGLYWISFVRKWVLSLVTLQHVSWLHEHLFLKRTILNINYIIYLIVYLLFNHILHNRMWNNRSIMWTKAVWKLIYSDHI